MRRALVIEDDPDIRRLLAYKLEATGFETATAGDAETGLGSVISRPPDLVLLDWMLPGMTGVDALRRLRAPDMPACAVIMVSARADPAELDLALRSGADDYLIKPFSLLELESRVGRLLAETPST